MSAAPPIRHRRTKAQAIAHNAITARPPRAPGEHVLDLPDSVRGRTRKTSSIPIPLDGGGVGLSWSFISERAPISLPVALRSLLQVVNTLAIRHRDLSKPPRERSFGALCPANLLFTKAGSALLPSDSQTVEQPIRYAAPECRAGLPPDQHSDIFALGVMLLEVLRRQELGDTEAMTLNETSAATDPKWVPFTSDKLFAVALKALATKPEARWSGVGDFAEALVMAAAGRLAPRSALADIVRAALARQGERATPVVQPPDVPRAPGAPRLAVLAPLPALDVEADEAPASDRVTSVFVHGDVIREPGVVGDDAFETTAGRERRDVLRPRPCADAESLEVSGARPIAQARAEVALANSSLVTVHAVSGPHELALPMGVPTEARRRWPALMAVAVALLGVAVVVWSQLGTNPSLVPSTEVVSAPLVAPTSEVDEPPVLNNPPAVTAESPAARVPGDGADRAPVDDGSEIRSADAVPSVKQQKSATAIQRPPEKEKLSAPSPKVIVPRTKESKGRYDPEGI